MVAEPGVVVYLPGGHLVWAMHKSVLVLLLDVKALKNPVTHDTHSGCVVAEPAVFVYLPGGHLVWAVHHSEGQSNTSVTEMRYPWIVH